MVEKLDPKQIAAVEEVLTLKQHRAKPVGETVARRFLPGDKYKQSGIEKYEALVHGYVTLDLKAKVPENKKRVAPEKGKEKFKSPYEMLVEQNKAILETLKEFGEAIKNLTVKK